MYSPQLLDHFEHPRNSGKLDAPDAAAEVTNPACGDILRLEIQVAAGRITAVRFRAKGCVAAIACASALTELMQSQSPAAAARIERHQILAAVGQLPQAATHASHLAIAALKSVLAKLAA